MLINDLVAIVNLFDVFFGSFTNLRYKLVFRPIFKFITKVDSIDYTTGSGKKPPACSRLMAAN